jgi:S-formylglutathione hydrolase FrmB
MKHCVVVCGLIAVLAPPSTYCAETRAGTQFVVTVAPGLLAKPTDGRVMVCIGKSANPEPRRTIGNTGMATPVILGADADGFTAGKEVAVTTSSEIFPIESLSALPAGDYVVQAVFDWNPDLRLPNAPGNLYSKPQKMRLDPAAGYDVKINLTEQVPAETLPKDTDTVKYLKFESKLQSQFFGRPMYLRVGIALPREFATEPDRKFPLLVFIGGYGTRFTAAARMGRFTNGSLPMVVLCLDGAGPYGDPYQVNSANNGPMGDAITQELIPHIEKTFRCIGDPRARFTTGSSTGGWVSFALQVFYPDFFNGCWSFAPDPVDFRSYELIDIYSDKNAYVNSYGFERPAMRRTNGETIYNVRHETQIENVMGRRNSWWRSGKDWCAWNATFGPRGDDGQPKPLWAAKSGEIDKSVVEFWKQRDLRHVLQTNWTTLAPKLAGKIHIYVGDADDYFLNNAVHRLDAAAKQFNPPFDGVIQFGAGADHGYHPVDEVKLMAERFEKAGPR